MTRISTFTSPLRLLSKTLVIVIGFILTLNSAAASELYIDPQFSTTETYDIEYGKSLTGDGINKPRYLDIYLPVGTGAPTNNRPAIVMMHGGYYTEGDKREDSGPVAGTYAKKFAERGYVAVSINYRLLLEDNKPSSLGAPLVLPPERHPAWMAAQLITWGVTEQEYFNEIAAATEDLAMAVNWLRAHADTYGIDPNRIAAGGYSAGAVSSLMLGANAVDGAHAEIGAVFSIAGGMFGLEPPIDSADPGVFVLHGTADTVVPYTEIGYLETALDAAGLAFGSHIVEGGTHASMPWDLADNPNIPDNSFFYQFMIDQLNLHANDRDLDGIPDEWEELYFGGITNANPSDLSSNGVNSVKDAYIAGIDPIDPEAYFEISINSEVCNWNTLSGRVYNIFWTTNLIDNFQPLETNLPWTQNTFTNENNNSAFYKLTVQIEE